MGKKIEKVTDFILLGSKSLWMVTAAMKLKDACSFQKKSYDKHSDHIKKNRDISLQTSVCIVNTMFFPVVM